MPSSSPPSSTARGVKTRLLTLGPKVPPIVYGELDVPGATKTYGVYVHYDGQPVVPEEWKSGLPFTPTLYSKAMADGGTVIPFPKKGDQVDPEWRIYARSASDDKGPIPAILAALDALSAAGIARQANFRFFLEGEEGRLDPPRGVPRQEPRSAGQDRRLADRRRAAPTRAGGRGWCSGCAAISASSSPPTARCASCTAATTATGRPIRRSGWPS